MTLSAFLRPEGALALYAWSFIVLSAVQVTIRLLNAYSAAATARAALALAAACYPVAWVYDTLAGPDALLGARLTWAPLALALMGLVGFACARWLLGLRRLRGQVAAGLMVGSLAPHLIALVPR